MAAALFITFMCSVFLFGVGFLIVTWRHYRSLAQSQTAQAKSALVKPPEAQ